MIGTIKHGRVTSMQSEMAYRFNRKAILPFTTNAYRTKVDGRRRKVAALIALVLVCAASLYRGGFGA